MQKVFKTISMACLPLTIAATAHAAELFPVRSFTEPIGGLYDDPAVNPASVWVGQRTLSLVNPITIEAGNLTYAPGGVPAPTGNRIRLFDTGQDISAPFGDGVNGVPNGTVTPAVGNTYYYSAILMIESGAGNSGDTTGDYVLHFANGQNRGVDSNFSGTGFRGRLYLFDNGSGGIGVGVQYSSDAATRNNATASAAFDTPFFAVVKITEIDSTTTPDNDIAELYLFTVAAPPSTEPGVADAISVGNNGLDHDIAVIIQGGLGRVGLRQGGGTPTAPQNVLIDELRAGTTWADVVPGTVSVSDWSLFN